jgi:hypothetical protein
MTLMGEFPHHDSRKLISSKEKSPSCHCHHLLGQMSSRMWDESLVQLKQFKTHEGRCIVHGSSHLHEGNRGALDAWVSLLQCKLRASGKLDAGKKKRVVEIGFE